MKEFMETVQSKCHDVHADYHLITTDQDYEEVVYNFLTTRLPKKGKK